MNVSPQDGLLGAVIGGGTMGIGIAYCMAAASWEVWVVEPSDEQAVRMRAQIEEYISSGISRGKLDEQGAESVRSRLRRVAATSELPSGLEVIIESVPERLELKHEVLRQAEDRAPKLLASNTSALSITELSSVLQRPAGFIGMHFFNPVPSLALVELVTGDATDASTVTRATEVVASIGKQAALVRDSPGFATSRLDVCLALEAMRMVEEGVASPEDIDRAVTLAYRHPAGPLRLTDIVGLDVRLDIARNLAEKLGPRFAPPALLEQKVAAGELGVKSGRGFYDW